MCVISPGDDEGGDEGTAPSSPPFFVFPGDFPAFLAF